MYINVIMTTSTTTPHFRVIIVMKMCKFKMVQFMCTQTCTQKQHLFQLVNLFWISMFLLITDGTAEILGKQARPRSAFHKKNPRTADWTLDCNYDCSRNLLRCFPLLCPRRDITLGCYFSKENKERQILPVVQLSVQQTNTYESIF